MEFPFSYGYGTMLAVVPVMPKLIGHTGSTGAFLYYCESNDTYISGSLNLTNSGRLTFSIIGDIHKAIAS